MLNTSWCRSERERLGHFPSLGWGCISAGRAPHRHAAEAGSIPRCGKGFFSSRVNFQCRLSYGVRTSVCAATCINICAHVKDPAVTSEFGGKTKTPSMHRVSQLACPRKAIRFSPGRKSQEENTVVIFGFFFFFGGGVNKIRWTVT